MKKTLLVMFCSIAAVFCISSVALATTDTSVENVEIVCDGVVYYVEAGETVSIPLYAQNNQSGSLSTTQNFFLGTLDLTYYGINRIEASVDLLSRYTGRIFWGRLKINDINGNLVADWASKSTVFNNTHNSSTASLTWDASHEISKGNSYQAYFYSGSINFIDNNTSLSSSYILPQLYININI